MKRIFLLIFILLAPGINNGAHAQKIINLSDYGVIPNSYQNASANMARSIKDAAGFDSCIMRFPGGSLYIILNYLRHAHG